MRVKNFFKYHRIWFVLVAMAVIWMGIPRLAAYAAVPGSVEIQLPAEAAGAEITLYAIGEIPDGTIHFYEPFTGCDFTILDLRDARKVEQAAEQFALLARENGVTGIAGTADGSGALRFSNLSSALYLAVQTGGQQFIEIQKSLIPVPYTMEDGTFCYDVVIDSKYSIPEGAVILYKTDDAGTSVAQARFVLQKKVYISAGGDVPAGVETGQDVGGRFLWEQVQTDLVTNAKGQLSVSGLTSGTYRFVELQAPEGFILTSAPCYFAIDQAGEVREVNGSFTVSSGQVPEVTVVNRRTSLTVNKVDSKGNAVAGAKLVVKDANGNVLLNEDGSARYAFTTTTEPTELKQLPAGEYYISEVEAPAGYRVAQDVKLTISDAEGAVNTVTMVDEKEEKTNASLSVTKKLMDLDEREIAPEDGTFYVALFSDEARTSRVSGVQALHYAGTSSETVTFSNLELDKTYYVGETTEYGELLEGGIIGGASYTPMYPDGYTVKLTSKKPEGSIAFQNVFFELPKGYYYNGELTITKKVVKGTQAFDSEEVFYAAIFEDSGYTQRYGDVITLEMGGGSKTSVTVPVTLGDDMNSSVTYYVTETDKDGNPLAGSSGFKYDISVDKTSVTMTPDQAGASVTITNTLKEETPSTDQSSSGSSSSTGSTVRTGDDTPVLRYVLLMAGATAVMIAVIAVYGSIRKKKREK